MFTKEKESIEEIKTAEETKERVLAHIVDVLHNAKNAGVDISNIIKRYNGENKILLRGKEQEVYNKIKKFPYFTLGKIGMTKSKIIEQALILLKTEEEKMPNDNYSQLEKFITKEKESIDLSDIDNINKNKKEPEPEEEPEPEKKDYPELEKFITKDKTKDIEYLFKHQDKYAQKRYFITSRRHQKPGDEHIPAPIVMLGCYARILVLEDNGSYTLHIRHADSSCEKQAVILDEDGANKDILTHKDFFFMIDDDFPVKELDAMKQIKKYERINQPEEKTSLDDIINNREKVRSLPIFIFKNTEKRENIEKIHDIIKSNTLGYTIVLDKDKDGFAILDCECDGTYRNFTIKELDLFNNFLAVHQGYDFYIDKETYKKLNKDALDKKELVLF